MSENLPIIVVVHAAAAIVALLIGGYQLYAIKGTTSHRVIGYVWAGLMMVVSVSSFWIHGIKQLGWFSVIHLLSLYVAVSLPVAVIAARRGHIARHRGMMKGMYIGGLLVAGLFTLAPGRVLGHLMFGL
jgi:uncharacterized membrane protein